jgi:Flp pilus assembly protein TadD
MPLAATMNVVCPQYPRSVSDPPFMLRTIRALILALALPGLPVFAQDDQEYTEEARRKYVADLQEAATLIKDRQFASAQERLDALIATRPREPRARFLKGIVDTEQGRTDAAMAVYRALIEDYPELPEPYNNLAVLLAQRGEYESARLALETALRTAPNWSVAHENLGDLYARLAAEQYARAAKLDHENKSAPAKLALARDLLAQAAPAKAIAP